VCRQSRKTWGVINELISRKSKGSFVNEIKCQGVLIADSSDLTESFNDHFVTVVPKLADEISTSVNNRSPLHYLSNHIHDHEPFPLELTNNSFSRCYIGLANPKQLVWTTSLLDSYVNAPISFRTPFA
jgi:hypothetical protein